MAFSTYNSSSPFRDKLRRGELVTGTWVNAIKDPLMAKLAGLAGFDYLLIDAEHSGATMASISEMCLLARECGVHPMVRPVNPDDYKANGRLLDAGAMGLVIPHINDARQAKAIVDSVRYFDGGIRGCSTRSIFSGFEKSSEASMRQADREVTVVAQFESADAVRQAEEILSVDGVDVAIVGRGDLAHSLALTGEGGPEQVDKMVEEVFQVAIRCGKTPGLLVNSAAEAALWMSRGARFLSVGNEVGWLLSAYQDNLYKIRAAYEKQTSS